nr:uncharacterized protein LOC109149216 [Ipomoea batatas]
MHSKWLRKSTVFTPPRRFRKDPRIGFVWMLYMDRLVIGSRVILRSISAFTRWTTRAMKDREFKEIRDGGFGLGTIDTPLREPTTVKEPDSVGQSSEFCAGQISGVQMDWCNAIIILKCSATPCLLSVGNGKRTY